MSRLGKILYLFSGLSVVGFLVTRFLLGGFHPAMWIPLALFLGGILGAFWVDRKLYLDFLSMKTTKHGMNMGLLILMVVIMLGAVNFVSVRHYKTFDFSLAQVNTLSDQSVKLLQSLDSDLKITYFYKEDTEDPQNNRRAFQNLIRKYQDKSTKVVLDYVDVNKRPDLAEEYGVNKGSGVVFLEYKGRKNRIEKIDEQEITGALVKVTREKDKIVYLVTGHGEGQLDELKDAYGLGSLKKLLEGNRYLLKPIALFTNPEIPKDADVVIVPGPRQTFADVEVKALEVYLKRGGSLFLAIDPQLPHGLDTLLAQVGIQPKNNFVITVVQTAFGRVADPAATPANEFSATHPVTKIFGKNEFAMFKLPQGIGKGNVPAGITFDEIVKTGENSFAYPDTKFKSEPEKGPFSIGVALKGKWPGAAEGSTEFNIILLGDGDFLSNELLYRNANRDLMLNSIVSLAKEENMISITPKEVAATQLTLTENKFYMFIFAFVIPLPLLMLVSSGFIWFRRRHA
jgi:ABC-type uncharacterized transport system involved in gliding motility auxiliary subunit